MNAIALSGRLTAAPTTRETSSGKPFATFGIAVGDGFRENVTHFFNIVAFRQAAEKVKDLPKGTMVGLTGQLQSRKFTTKDGQEKQAMEVVAERLEVIARAGSTGDRDQDREDEDPFGDQ